MDLSQMLSNMELSQPLSNIVLSHLLIQGNVAMLHVRK